MLVTPLPEVVLAAIDSTTVAAQIAEALKKKKKKMPSLCGRLHRNSFEVRTCITDMALLHCYILPSQIYILLKSHCIKGCNPVQWALGLQLKLIVCIVPRN